ncbi:Aste57867_11583 [Aphanomyces stellatus]|uniref:Aste57867_11583 protein n=1 Tax=Aphanomyces stellatus TaxID=120398 RepID=A0A485KTW2_9STRA|nr:hypothetical protein As57867_011540 [Aphanomyces stellatus]VFT88442.1 Aste57867_11583 [Aphanomyces stellatus]
MSAPSAAPSPSTAGAHDGTSIAPPPLLHIITPPPPPSSGTGWMQRIEQMKSSAMAAKKQWAPQLQQLTVKIATTATSAASTGRDRIRSSGVAEQFQPAMDKAKVGMTVLKRRVSTTSQHVQKQVGMLGTRLAQELFVEKKLQVDMESTTSPLQFLADSRHLLGCLASDAQASPADKCFDTPYLLLTILAFSGCAPTVARCAALNSCTRQHLLADRRVLRFCVRYGTFTPRLRLRFWQHVTGVDALQAASDYDYDTYMHMAISKGDWTDAILTDVRRTYGRVAPHRRSDNDCVEPVDTEEELQQQLSAILHALSGRFPDVGYCQGMDYITAHLLEHVKAADMTYGGASPRKKRAATTTQVETTFWLMVALFESYGLREMFSPGLDKLHLHCYQFSRLFELGLPTLAAHFQTEYIMVEMYLVGWFQTLFLYLNALPKATLDAIWDVFLFEKNWKIMFRISLALLHQSERALLGQSIDDVMRYLNTFAGQAETLQPQPLLAAAFRIKVTNKMLLRLQRDQAKDLAAKKK